jgi:hypothetical protein
MPSLTPTRRLGLAALLLAAACGGQEAGTFVLLDLQLGRGAPPAEGLQAIALEIDLGGKKTMTALRKGDGAITLPTTASLEIGAGAGPLVIVARALDAAGAQRGAGTGMGQVARGATARVTIAIDFDAGGWADGGAPGPGDAAVARDAATVGDASAARDMATAADMRPAPTDAAPPDGQAVPGPDGSPAADGPASSDVPAAADAASDLPPAPDLGSPDGGPPAEAGPGADVGPGTPDAPAPADATAPDGAAAIDADTPDAPAPPPPDAAPDLPPDAPPAPALELDKTMHDYGSVVNNTSSTPVIFTVSNTGNAPSGTLMVSLTSSPDMQYAIASDGCSGMTLAAAASCTVSVRMTPTMTGSPTATLAVSATPGGMLQASLSGMSVTQGSITIEPMTRDFGSVVLGNLTEHSFTVRNVGGAPTGAITMSLAGTDASQFLIVNDGCMGRTLPGGGTCTLTVRFAPNTKGFKSASLTGIAAPGGSGIATVTGTALAPALLSVSPTSNDFGTIDVGMMSAATTFTVRNDGDDTSGVPSASLGGTDSGQYTVTANTCTAALAAGATCTVSVAFAPTSYNVKNATLAVTASPGGTAIAALRGTGRDWFALSVTRTGTGTGTVTASGTTPTINCGATCSGNAPRTTGSPMVTLTATPAASSTFDSWSGCDSVSGTTCSVTLTDARMVTATFAIRTFTLTVTKTESDGAAGTVASQAGTSPAIDCGSTCMGTYAYGTTVTLTATPSMHHFGGWGGACSGFLTCSVSMTADRAVTARFNPANKMFVTPTTYSIATIKSMGTGATAAEQMASGADRICGNVATAAGLPGTFVAFLSLSSTVTAASRLGASRGWVRADGRPFADSITSPQYLYQTFYPPSLDAAGNTVSVANVLTASSHTGGLFSTSYTCNNWMDTSTTYYSRVGISTAAAPIWATYTLGYCDASFSLYCLQTNYAARIAAPPVPGTNRKVIFVSRNSFPNFSGGVTGADALCGMDAAGAGLTGTFKAMLATTTSSIASRFTTTGVPVYRPDGVMVAAMDTQLLAASPSLLAPINVDPTGTVYLTTYVWTGSTNLTTPTPMTAPPLSCADWTTNLSGNSAYAGYTPYTNLPSSSYWIYFTTYPCNSSSPRLYCLQD